MVLTNAIRKKRNTMGMNLPDKAMNFRYWYWSAPMMPGVRDEWAEYGPSPSEEEVVEEDAAKETPRRGMWKGSCRLASWRLDDLGAKNGGLLKPHCRFVTEAEGGLGADAPHEPKRTADGLVRHGAHPSVTT